MSDWIAIPFRGPPTAKSRLSETLDADQRAELAIWLFRRVLAIACAVVPPSRVIVVTPAQLAADIAREAGAGVVTDDGSSLNAALALAHVAIQEECASGRLLIVSADLPRLHADDLTAMLDEKPERVAIAPDAAHAGTNALRIPIAADFGFRFGEGSFVAHIEEAARLGGGTVVVERPGLAADLDHPADLALLAMPGSVNEK